MTDYIMNRDKLKEVLLGHKSFLAIKCREMMAQGIDVMKLTYRETDKITDEFIDTIIKSLPVETMLDDVDKALSKSGLKSSKEYLKEHHERNSKIKS